MAEKLLRCIRLLLQNLANANTIDDFERLRQQALDLEDYYAEPAPRAFDEHGVSTGVPLGELISGHTDDFQLHPGAYVRRRGVHFG